MLRGLVACVFLSAVAQLGCAAHQRRHKGLRHHAVHHKNQHLIQGWSLPPLSKIFRGSEKTVNALEENVQKLKNAVRDLRGKNLEEAKETYTGFTQALTVDDEQDQKLEAENNEVEKKINALELSNKAEEQRKDTMIKENAKLTKQLEELKRTVNAQVEGLEGILKTGIDIPKETERAASIPSAAAPVHLQAAAAPQPEYCQCTKSCADLGWGEWCPVQSANCVTKLPCTTGGAANTCVTVDPQVGPWTRCANIITPQAVSLIQTSRRDDEDDSDSDSDDDDDAKSVEAAQPACRCRTPCQDQGWGMWCYLQAGNCRVKEQCEMGGAADACVASDPAGPWTRCSNLLPADAVAPAQPVPSRQIASSTPQLQTYNEGATPAVQQTFSSNANPVKDLLVKMMTQVDDIRSEDQQSSVKMQELYQSETAKMQSTRNAIQERQTELASRLREVKGQSAKLAAEVDHLEEVNRSLHTQLHRLEKFLSSASSELHGSMENEERVATAALQMRAHGKSKKDDDDDDDNDEGDDDNENDD